MDKNSNAEKALSNLEKTLKNFHENASKNSDGERKNVKDTGEKINNETTSETVDLEEGKGYVSDFFIEENIGSRTSDLEKNPKEAFNQFKVKPVASDSEKNTAVMSHQKTPSAEEIAKNWQELGVQRCPNCKFRTEDEELYRNHCTTCPAVKSAGMIKLTYKNEEFCCSVCDDDIWSNRSEFEEHVVCHLQDSPYVCLTCHNKKFSSRQQIEIHTKIEHPNGDARCGLKGMKTGRKYTEELIQTGTISIHGKLSIPKTPRNHIGQITSSKEKSSHTESVSEAKPTAVAGTSTAGNDIREKSSGLISSNPIPPAVVTALQPHVIPINSTTITGVGTIHYKPEVLNMNSAAQIVTKMPILLPSTAVSVPYASVAASSASLQVSSVLQPVTGSQNMKSAISEASSESDSNRPMPPARTSINIPTNIAVSHIYTSKGGTSHSDEAKSKHLDSLFGELNRTTNVMQPTTISQKIKDIANPSHDLTKKEAVSKPIPYNLKTITEYTCTAAVKTVAPPISSMPPQNLLLVPVGQPIMQPHGPLAIPNTGIIYQTAKHGCVLLPKQPVNQTALVTSISPGTNIRGQMTTGVTSMPQNLQVVSQITSNPVVLTTGPTQVNRSSNNNMNVTGNQSYITQPVGSAVSGSSSANLLPSILPKSLQNNSLPSYEEAVADRRDAVGIDGQQIPKKYLFKIKPGQGFVCEFCKKFTRDEYVFRRHIWEHFHGDPLACRTCSADSIARKVILECKLVNNIVCNLIKRSVIEQEEDNTKPLKVLKVGDTEVIDITDDEVDKDNNKPPDKQDQATEVIVLDDDDENGDGQGLKIQISNRFSLSDPQNFEQMSKKDSYQNVDGHVGGTRSRGKEGDQLSAQSKTSQSKSNVQSESGVQETSTYTQRKMHDASKDTKNTNQNDVTQKKLYRILSTEKQKQIDYTSDVEDLPQVSKDPKSTDTLSGLVNVKKYSDPKKPVEAGDNATEFSKDMKSTDDLSGQAHLKKYFDDKKTTGAGDNASELSKSSPIHEESEDDEDGKLKGNLIDKSLSEPGKDSEEVVSQVLETNLKIYDPTDKTVERTPREETDMDVNNTGSNDQVSKDSDTPTGTSKSHEKDAQGTSADTHIDQMNLPGKNVFDTQILSKQSHNAFYICGYENCTFTCMSSSKYREHIQSKEHGNEYNYVCGHCGQKDYTEDTHVRHIFTHANSKTFLLYKCPIRLCKYKTNLLHLYAEHLRAHPNEELSVICVYCHKTFPTIDSLVQHLKQNLLKFVVCPYCSFKFVNRYVVMVHIKHFHPDKIRMVSVTSQVVCNEREINFYVSPKSKAFIHTDISEKDIADADNLDIPALLDDFEKENVGQEKNLQEQSTAEKGSENSDTDYVLSLPEEDQSDFKEKENRLKGQKESQMESPSQRHVKSKGKSDMNTKAGPKSLECPQCSFLSYNLSLHAKHLSLHETEPEREKRFVCNLCPKGSENLPHFRTHVGNHVGKHVIKVLSCTTCAYSSNQKSHIMDHVRDAHSEETMYTLKEEVIESNHSECRYCTFKARTSEQVVAHETAVHRIDPRVSLSKNLDKVYKNKEQGSENSENSHLPAGNESSTSDNSEDLKRKKKYKYHCEYCSDFFKHKSNLKEHIVNDHKDTEHKQFVFFKCKYCVYTSTMKNMIIGHLGEEHPGMDLRILRKIEVIESLDIDTSESCSKELEKDIKSVNVDRDGKDKDTNSISEANKEEIVIPDGNVFKQLFSCPKCPFTSNMRIKTMKHLKEHPELKPVRPDQQMSPSKKTARKSSSSSRSNTSGKKSSLIQQIPKSSEPLQNPFIAVKESVVTKDIPSLDAKLPVNSPSKDPYILGEQKLHTSLSACFIPLEKDMKYQCRICKQKIFKKFVLHRHILDHLKIAFFKCRYCEEGRIERTLMAGHIQKDHPSRPVLYDSVEKSVLEQQLKERIFNQDFNDTVDLFAASRTPKSSVDEVKNSGIVRKAVHEFQTIDDESENEDDGTEEPVAETEETDNGNTLKCPKCRYVARYKHNLNLHLDSHEDPMKTFTCSVCDYRGDKFSVIKHVYRVFHFTQPKVLQNGQPLYDNLNAQKMKNSMQTDKGRHEGKTSVSEVLKKGEEKQPLVESESSLTNTQGGKQIKVESLTVSKAGVFEIRASFKCRVCGEKRDSKSAMYHHFKSSKCNKPVVKCSRCSFQSTVKAAIHRHAAKRHPGKKVSLLSLPVSSKFLTIKIPVRQDKSIANYLQEKKNVEESNTVPAHTQKEEMDSKIKENEPSDSGQIRCQICANYVCESIMKLQFHVNTAHQGAVLHCKKCSYKTPIVKHMINHCKHLHLQRVALYGSKVASSDKKTESATSVKPEKVSRTIIGDDKIVFKCPKCNLEFKSLQTVQVHLYVHFNYRPYCCKYCGKNMARAAHVRKHIANLHDGKSVKYDTNFDELIESKVKKIFDRIKRNVVKQRTMLGKNRPSYLDHMELIEEGIRKSGKLFYCDYCRYKADRRNAIRNHVASLHAGISKKRPLEIDSDTESPVKKVSKKEKSEDLSIASSKHPGADEEENETEQHDDSTPLKYKVIKSSSGTKKYKCSGCDYVNEKIKNLKLHVWRHHNSSTHRKDQAAFRCYFCAYASIHSSSDIHKHFRSHHPSKNIKYRNKSGDIVSRDRPANRDDRSSPAKSTSSSSPARSVTESATSDFSPVKPMKRRTGVTNYNCEICGYSGEGFYHFRLHLMAHTEFTQITSELDEESRMSCGFCTYLAKNTFDLSSHIASHMAGMRYKCAYCDYVHYEKSKVSQHWKNWHADREEIVIDRELRKRCNGTIKLVNFNPVVELNEVKYRAKKRKYRRIMIETDESSSSSSSDVEDNEVLSLTSAKRPDIRTMDTKVAAASTSKHDNSRQIDGSDTSLSENRNKDISNDKCISFSSSDSVITEENKGECKSHNSESENSTFSETQMFRIESQPFSPSDLMDTEGIEFNETSNTHSCPENDDNCTEVRFSVDSREAETGKSVEAPEIHVAETLSEGQQSEFENEKTEQTVEKAGLSEENEINSVDGTSCEIECPKSPRKVFESVSDAKDFEHEKGKIEQTVQKTQQNKEIETKYSSADDLLKDSVEDGTNHEIKCPKSPKMVFEFVSDVIDSAYENDMVEQTVEKAGQNEENETKYQSEDDLLKDSVDIVTNLEIECPKSPKHVFESVLDAMGSDYKNDMIEQTIEKAGQNEENETKYPSTEYLLKDSVDVNNLEMECRKSPKHVFKSVSDVMDSGYENDMIEQNVEKSRQNEENETKYQSADDLLKDNVDAVTNLEMECLKSPKRVFESVSNLKDSEYENDMIEQTIGNAGQNKENETKYPSADDPLKDSVDDGTNLVTKCQKSPKKVFESVSDVIDSEYENDMIEKTVEKARQNEETFEQTVEKAGPSEENESCCPKEDDVLKYSVDKSTSLENDVQKSPGNAFESISDVKDSEYENVKIEQTVEEAEEKETDYVTADLLKDTVEVSTHHENDVLKSPRNVFESVADVKDSEHENEILEQDVEKAEQSENEIECPRTDSNVDDSTSHNNDVLNSSRNFFESMSDVKHSEYENEVVEPTIEKAGHSEENKTDGTRADELTNNTVDGSSNFENDVQKSPRNVFETVSDLKDSEYENEVTGNSETNCVRAVDLLKDTVDITTNHENKVYQNTTVVKDHVMMTDIIADTTVSERVEPTNTSNSGCNTMSPMYEDRCVENTKTSKSCNADSVISDRDTDTNIDVTSTSEMKFETENAFTCSDSVVMNATSTSENEGPKSPRNVFESISDVNKSESNFLKPFESESTVIPHCAGEDGVNVNASAFENLTSVKLGESSEMSDRHDNDGKSCVEGKDNIFEMLSKDSTNKAASIAKESESQPDPANMDDSDKNIFEQFGGVDSENTTEDTSLDRKKDNADKKRSDYFSSISSKDPEEITKDKSEDENEDNESNIFVKFSSEKLKLTELVEPDHGQDQQKSSVVETNLFTKFLDNRLVDEEKGGESEEDIDSNKNLFEKFAVENLDSQASNTKDISDSEMNLLTMDTNEKVSGDTSLVESENPVEDMEVDELIQSIEKTVNESVKEREGVSRVDNMETD